VLFRSGDLLIVARQRPDFYDAALQFRAPHVEVRLDTRTGERRQAASDASEERRRGDRRALDVREQLRTIGWVLVPAADRIRGSNGMQ